MTEPAPTSRPRRRVPSLVWGALGAGVALGYGMLALKMQLGPPLVMVALGGMTLAFAAGALWRIIDPLTRADEAGSAVVTPPRRARALEREKQLVLKAIKEIELDYQMRKVAERDYREMVERYRTRAMRLISELEAGDDFRTLIEQELQMRLKRPVASEPSSPPPAATEASPAAAPSCPSCGTNNDHDAQFCKKCGAKL